MVNLLRLCERMTKEYINQNDLAKIVELDFFKSFAKRNNFTILEKKTATGFSYKLKREGIKTYYIENMQNNEFSWLDLADLHIGHMNFNETLLRDKLQQAVDQGIKLVFIAGDIFEGVPFEQFTISYQEALKIQGKQIRTAFSIFNDYPLTYYAINGNHDYTYEPLGLHNPIDLLQRTLKMSDCDFNYIDSYVADFIISGFCKRLIHIEQYVDVKYGICAVERYKKYTPEELDVEYDGKKYPIRFFTCGHIHTPMDLYYRKKKVYISQPGSFINYGGDCDPGIFVSGKFEDGKMTRYE